MNLTEAQAGTDLGAIRTRAEDDGKGGYLLKGQKIFITHGEHDFVAEHRASRPGAPSRRARRA